MKIYASDMENNLKTNPKWHNCTREIEEYGAIAYLRDWNKVKALILAPDKRTKIKKKKQY